MRRGLQSLYLISFCQLGIGLVFALLVFCFIGKQDALSALMGMATAIIPTILFGQRFFRLAMGISPEAILKNLFRGELLKIVVTALLFYLCIRYLTVNFLWFILSYFFCQMAFWLAPWISFKHKVRSV